MTAKNDSDKLSAWVEALSDSEMRHLIIEIVERGIETEEFRMGDLSPYWESCGEPLVPGQQIWKIE